MKKLLFILFLTPVFANAQYLHFYTNQITGYTKDSIQIDDKMYYAVPPTLTEDGDIVHKGHLDNALAGISLDSTNYYRTKSDFEVFKTDQVITNSGLLFQSSTSPNAFFQYINAPNVYSMGYSDALGPVTFLAQIGALAGDQSTFWINADSLSIFTNQGGNIARLRFRNGNIKFLNSNNNTPFVGTGYTAPTDSSLITVGIANSNYWNSQVNTTLDTGQLILQTNNNVGIQSIINITNSTTPNPGTYMRIKDLDTPNSTHAEVFLQDYSVEIEGNILPSGLAAQLRARVTSGTTKGVLIAVHENGMAYVGNLNGTSPDSDFGALAYLRDYGANFQDGDNGGTVTRDLVIPHIRFIIDSLIAPQIADSLAASLPFLYFPEPKQPEPINPWIYFLLGFAGATLAYYLSNLKISSIKQKIRQWQ